MLLATNVVMSIIAILLQLATNYVLHKVVNEKNL